MEAGYSGRDLADLRIVAERRKSLYVVLPITEAIAERARDVQIRMAARGHHRAAGVFGLLTAAVAEHHGAAILHYDADFEHIAAVTGQHQTWIAPPRQSRLISGDVANRVLAGGPPGSRCGSARSSQRGIHQL